VTMRREIQALGMREAREKWRSIVTHVIDGQPILILRDLQPSAVMLRFDEVQRWRRIEESLSALHGLEIYPELARSTAALAALVRGHERASVAALRGLARQSRDILGALRTMAVSDVPRGFAALLDEIESGRLMTIVVKKQLAVTLVSPREYDRLRSLTLAVTWFRTAGLDLETAEPDQISAWVRDFRERPAAAASEATGA
jgi:PHD/YefM family antitoxin component YafN of YafNO toxin-antitoxin module